MYDYLLAYVLGFATSWLLAGVFFLVRHCVRERKRDRELDGIWTGRAG